MTSSVQMRDQGSNPDAWPHWTSPPPLVHRAKIALGDFIDLDPCSNDESIVDASIRIYEDGRVIYDGEVVDRIEGGGLKANWSQVVERLQIRLSVRPSVYVNPDFSVTAEWVRRCVTYRDYMDIVLVVPSRTSSKWYHHAAAASRLIGHWGPGRIEFGNPPPWSKGNNPSIAITVFYMGRSPDFFREAFRDKCLITEHYR